MKEKGRKEEERVCCRQRLTICRVEYCVIDKSEKRRVWIRYTVWESGMIDGKWRRCAAEKDIALIHRRQINGFQWESGRRSRSLERHGQKRRQIVADRAEARKHEWCGQTNFRSHKRMSECDEMPRSRRLDGDSAN